MKSRIADLILICFDLLAIFISISMAYYTRVILDPFLILHLTDALTHYTTKPLFYFIPLLTFYFDGIYTRRFDFWHESRQVLKSLLLSLLLVFTIIALLKHQNEYSRLVIILSFVYMGFFIPLFKNIVKTKLYKIGLWQKKAKIYGDDFFIENEIFQNHYLGYVKANESTNTVFINSQGLNVQELNNLIENQINETHEVIFIPLINQYNMMHSLIYELSNTRTNLIVIKNRLKSKTRLILQQLANYIFAILLLPILLPIFGLLAILIKTDEPHGSILFKQTRMGKNGTTFTCYKFRTMKENSEAILQKYLNENPTEIKNYGIYHKYENDPRITNIGQFLRKTSLDELPQIINILKGEMLFIGPRPYMLDEKEKIGKSLDLILAVKPGITGLWQVSGRNNIDFYSRVELDSYYTKNWSIWLDIVILLKTIKVVLFREGAY